MKVNLIRRSIPFALFATAALAQTPVKAPPSVDFQREIRPLLSENCFQCHGPDPDTRMADLRLDLKESAPKESAPKEAPVAQRKRGPVIIPGKSAESLLYQRISSPDASRRMPPERSHKSLTAAQIAKIKLWIDQGAPWQEHWAFHAPVKPSL